MTIDEAVKVLNDHRHHGHAAWYTNDPNFVMGPGQYEFFELFEAVAIAEKYARIGDEEAEARVSHER